MRWRSCVIASSCVYILIAIEYTRLMNHRFWLVALFAWFSTELCKITSSTAPQDCLKVTVLITATNINPTQLYEHRHLTISQYQRSSNGFYLGDCNFYGLAVAVKAVYMVVGRLRFHGGCGDGNVERCVNAQLDQCSFLSKSGNE